MSLFIHRMSLFIHHLFAALQSIYRVNFPGLLAPDTQKCFMTTDKKNLNV